MSGMKKVTIKIASQEQQENLKNTRKSLKVLQQSAVDKENLTGRTLKDTKLASENDFKLKKVANKLTQTDQKAEITKDDLISDEPSADYWRKLAEKRQEFLDESLKENEILKENIDTLKEENRICKEMLDESRHLVEVLQEMLNESGNTEIGEEATEEAT